jgi:predicted RNase H-like HicB family nuclease
VTSGSLAPNATTLTATTSQASAGGLSVTELMPILEFMERPLEIEVVFAPQDEGGYHVYAPDLPGLHTQGDTMDEATANAQEALALYVEGMREDGRSLDSGVIRRKFPIPA